MNSKAERRLPWTVDEDAVLSRLLARGASDDELATAIPKRSLVAIQNRRKKLDLVRFKRPTTRVIVVAATTERATFQIPSWSTELAVVLDRHHPDWPPPGVVGLPQPAMNIQYECELDLGQGAGDVPIFRRWYPVETTDGKPAPIATPLPIGPGHLLPVHDGQALARLLSEILPEVPLEQRRTIAYLVRRAHGQGRTQA